MKRLMILVSLFLFVNAAQATETEKPKEKQSPNRYEVVDAVFMPVEEGFPESSEKNLTKETADENQTKD